jgi:hypothetical protein
MIDIKAIEKKLEYSPGHCVNGVGYELVYEDLPALIEAVKEFQSLLTEIKRICNGWQDNSDKIAHISRTIKKAEAWLKNVGGE